MLNATFWVIFKHYEWAQNYAASFLGKYARGESTVFEITENVSFNIASEASYVYILSGQKFIKNAKNHPLWQPEAWGQTVLPDMTEKELKPTRVGL